MSAHHTKHATVRSACYTNHKTKQTAVALTIKFNDDEAEEVFVSSDTYAALWLETMGKMLLMMQKKFKQDDDVHLKLISGDPNCNKMANKIELMYIKLLKKKKPVTEEVIHRVVHAQGQFKSLPNDILYVNVLTLLWNCRKRFNHFIFEQHKMTTPVEYRMAKLAVDADVMKKRIPLKG
jgi:hypothetical protein